MTKAARTSLSHPLQIAELPIAPGMGLVGITFCPGKVDPHSLTGPWDRDLGLDLDAVAAWGASAVVTLVEAHELASLKVPHMGAEVEKRHMAWYHLPIPDVTAPGPEFEAAWTLAGPAIRARLRDGFRILVHCKGGLGRAGTIAARLGVELGLDPAEAVRRVRQVRKGAIETERQLQHVMARTAVTERVPATDAAARRDRAIGALLGLAVADAVGTTLEFAPRNDTADRLTDMVGGGPFKLAAGGWTDDTSMALALADSLIAHVPFDAGDLMQRFVSWMNTGAYSHTGTCFDIGITTRNALQTFIRTKDAFAGSTDPQTAGNGSLMRLSPVAIRFWNDTETRRAVAAAQSRTTHAAQEAVDACAFFADLTAEAIAGRPRADILSPRSIDASAKIAAIAAGSWRGAHRKAIKGSGYVVDALKAALWCVGSTASFRDVVLMAANLRDDADTTAAITGQLAGALYGASAIPQDWLDRVKWRAKIEEMADALWRASGPSAGDRSAPAPHPAAHAAEVGASSLISGRALFPGEEHHRLRPISMTPPEHPVYRRAARVIAMVHELHKAGYQRIRISPGEVRYGREWRCAVTYSGNVKTDGWTIEMDNAQGGLVAHYSTDADTDFFGIPGGETMTARQLARAFLVRFPVIAEKGTGRDWAYAGWLTDVLGRAEQGGPDCLVRLFVDGTIDQPDTDMWSPPPVLVSR